MNKGHILILSCALMACTAGVAANSYSPPAVDKDVGTTKVEATAKLDFSYMVTPLNAALCVVDDAVVTALVSGPAELVLTETVTVNLVELAAERPVRWRGDGLCKEKSGSIKESVHLVNCCIRQCLGEAVAAA